MAKEMKTIDISWESFWRFFIIAAIFVLAYFLRSVIMIFFVALIIAAAFEPLVDWFEKKHISRLFGTLIIYITFIILVVIILYFSLPFLYGQFVNLSNLIPGFSEKLMNLSSKSEWSDQILNILASYQGSFWKDISNLISVLFGFGGNIVEAITIFLISFYLLLKKDGMASFIKFVFPTSIESMVLKIWNRSSLRLGKWLRMQFVLSSFIGLLSLVALLILDVKYAFVLALVAAVCELVPVAGPIVSGFISALVALTQSFPLAIWTAIAFIIIQRIENDIVIPLLMGKTIGFNPVVVLLALLAGAKLGGIVGAIIALPVVIVIEETVKELNKKQQIKPLPLP